MQIVKKIKEESPMHFGRTSKRTDFMQQIMTKTEG